MKYAKVLIVSKTKMKDRCCVGGITLGGKFVRLLTSDGKNQHLNTDFEVRQLWEIKYIDRTQMQPPHVEDILTLSYKCIGKLNKNILMKDYLCKLNIPIWQGIPDSLFSNKLKWTQNGCGYIGVDDIPDQSVGFWISDKDLKKSIGYDKTRYNCITENGWRSLAYVGCQEPVEIIPKGTLIRISLARWWDNNGTLEKRCSLQLSGWYDLDN